MSTWGAIFDFDGVILDTERHHEICWEKVAQERKASLSRQQFVNGFGVKNERFIREILGWTQDPEEIERIAKRKEALFQEHAATHAIGLIPGVEQFLDELTKKRVPCAIASSSILKNIELLLRHSSVKRYFSQIVSGEDVSHGKPHPEVFLKAAKKLGLAPERCVVFEDALLGVEAAVRAGSKVVALTTTFAKKEFESLPFCPDLLISDFNEEVLSTIERWF